MKLLFTLSCILMVTTSIFAKSTISNEVVQLTIDILKQKKGESQSFRIERGVKKSAQLWQTEDGTPEAFSEFCVTHFISNEAELQKLFSTFSRNIEILNGSFVKMGLQMREPLDLDMGDYSEADEIFGGYNAGAHWVDDMYSNKLAFVATLNFPEYSLNEKNELGKSWSRQQWAYARLGELFKVRMPSNLVLDYSSTLNNAEMYIASYNIMAGQLRDNKGKALFPKEMKLLSHWNLRDELKSNYADKKQGLDKQRMIAKVMQRIVDQTIPKEVINNASYTWNPYSNEVKKDDKKVIATPENDGRYTQMINLFHQMQRQDECYDASLNTYIKRNFDSDMEMPVEEVEKLFVEFVSSPEVKNVASVIQKRLGRNLEPFDIWYDGFKSRSSLDQNKLTEMTRSRFPNPAAFEKEMPAILRGLGFTPEKATYLSERITVDPARGSGHAAGAAMKGDKAHLRTRIAANGMDYKGYNIAVHEFGHNVEQTFSLYNVDYYLLNGVPNTAFTEALAFMFQSRDLQILGINNNDSEAYKMYVLDNFWSLYEIMGVSLVDIRIWKWLYAHPNATPVELKAAVISIASDVWNNYYSPVLGQKDVTLFAIYSHMISYPLYLSAYSFGNLIQFQLENQVKGKDFGKEIERIFTIGRLTPDQWMMEATGSKISVHPILKAVDEVTK
ncbi:MAG: hypothetical protein PHV20_08230 [Bacteroidales bacterium]|nr:hypothetical protein [Bacteroidales bacterium]